MSSGGELLSEKPSKFDEVVFFFIYPLFEQVIRIYYIFLFSFHLWIFSYRHEYIKTPLHTFHGLYKLFNLLPLVFTEWSLMVKSLLIQYNCIIANKAKIYHFIIFFNRLQEWLKEAILWACLNRHISCSI